MSIIERALNKAKQEDREAVETAEGLTHQPAVETPAPPLPVDEVQAPGAALLPAGEQAAPRVERAAHEPEARPLLRVEDLRCAFDVSRPFLNRLFEREPRRWLKAVDGVSFDIARGETFALVGESGCGKSTVARLIVGLYEPSAGRIVFDGRDVALVTRAAERQKLRRRFQMIFQDPYASLNPRWRVERIIAEPIRVFGLERDDAAIRARVAELLDQVGLSPADGSKYPHEFSGGQRQRICIARALANRPEFLVCDEPTSALDVSVQAQILNLMRDLQDALGLTYLFISHDLAVVRHMANQVGVMYLGRIVELASRRRLFERPRHPYTRMLLATIPSLDMRGRREELVRGEVPNPITPPPGCSFHPRCPLADARCRSEAPVLHALDQGQRVACHAVEEGRDAVLDEADAGSSARRETT
ncbi:oligopeptide/dipeptide ABC transporter ATP-binding protein [Thauera sp.]|uniref:ABC transporter ATP-binding protein n=1 Tax=Thauera sp. TaxID=1905334 RepID=UPI002CF9A075|nr:oligopeptide/dipeptide ABC transporter ATP-binding protein [Thauera sp.]HRP22836.1 ATP-binding cassette domain-containing protein [Thauera sp.]